MHYELYCLRKRENRTQPNNKVVIPAFPKPRESDDPGSHSFKNRTKYLGINRFITVETTSLDCAKKNVAEIRVNISNPEPSFSV